MIISVDIAALEWRVAGHLSKCKVVLKEIIDGFDSHSDNQIRFGLPERRIAKVFLFRILYGGSAYGFMNDPDFNKIGNLGFWEDVIDKLYEKYPGLKSWHDKIVQEVNARGFLLSETGRKYVYSRDDKGDYPRAKILNYLVQGLGADLVTLYRIALYEEFKFEREAGILLFINTVHDSVVIDFNSNRAYNEFGIHWHDICQRLYLVTDRVPGMYKHRFGVDFSVPFVGEVTVGLNQAREHKIKRKK